MKLLLLGIIWILSVPGIAQISFKAGPESYTKDFRSGVAVMVTDANGDGRDDIIRMHNGNRVTVTLQGQEDRFLSTYFFQISGGEQWNITGGDIDNDGGFDIITSGVYDRVKIFRSIPFSNSYNADVIDDQTFFSQASNVVDINNDGYLDLFICNDDEKSVIFMNDSTGHLVRNDTIIDFTTAVPSDNSGNYGSIWSDIDSDGDLDLYIAKCRIGVNDPSDPRRINALYLNDGDTTYTESADSFQLAIGAQSWTADFGDIDNDGDFDLFITNHDVAGMLLENIDNVYFDDITDSSGVEVLGIAMQGTFRDFDNDGLLDLIVSGSNNYLYRNVGENQFEQVTDLFSDRKISSYGIGDLNSDGFLDVYASYNELFNDPHPILDDIIWFNAGNDNHYLSINLTGTNCNTSAVGARLYLFSALGMQTREVRAGEGYGITNSLIQHFGLGQDVLADSLIIIWPCGMKEVFPELAVNTAYYLEEGKCLTHLIDIGAGPFTQCSIESFTFAAPDGYSEYLWSTGSTEKEIMAIEPGLYHVSLTDDQGCTWVAGPLVISPVGDTEPDSIEITVEGRVIACAGADITLSGPPGALAYLWSNGDTTSSIVSVSGGEYSLQAEYICSTLST
ncbi:MAG TPA: CRTAC1 family protein, partial [Saprospiraceae bacterium]|nr:CRTAC1 family protein [Saprospiraceae bacterium]